MRRMAMEEPERENIKLPFLQGCKTLCLTKTCTNCNHESLKVTHTIFFLHFRTLLREQWHFFSTLLKHNMYFMNTALGFCLYCRLEYACGDVCVNTMWAATSPTVAAKGSMWPQYRHIFIHSKTGILNLFTSGETVYLWLSKAFVGFIFPPPLYLSKNLPSWGLGICGKGLRFSDMGTKCLKTEVRWCLVPACCQETPNCFPGLHLVAFHQSIQSLMAFSPLFLLISGSPSKSCSHSLKTLQIIPENPAMEL